MAKKELRYKCDNPNCTSILMGGYFIKDEGKCPYCGSTNYHSFEFSIESLKKVIDDLLKKEEDHD